VSENFLARKRLEISEIPGKFPFREGTYAYSFRHPWRIHLQGRDYTVKKVPVPFPVAGRDASDQTLFGREYDSFEFSRIFPSAARNSHRILLNQLLFLFTGISFPGYSYSPARN
jgi:hypothetical protein